MVVEGEKAKWDTFIPHFLKPRKSQGLKWFLDCFCCCLCCTSDNFNTGNRVSFSGAKYSLSLKIFTFWNSCFCYCKVFLSLSCFSTRRRLRLPFLLLLSFSSFLQKNAFRAIFPLYPSVPYSTVLVQYVGCLDKKGKDFLFI